MDGKRAYLDALRMLSRRELSEAQVRQRLARRGHDARAIDEAVARLVAERAIDDARTAGSIARIEAGLRKRGTLRVLRKIESAGISAATARRAVNEVFGDIDGDELLESALARRLRRDAVIADERELNRLYRYLVGQGFEPERVLAKLRGRTRRRRQDHD